MKSIKSSQIGIYCVNVKEWAKGHFWKNFRLAIAWDLDLEKYCNKGKEWVLFTFWIRAGDSKADFRGISKFA